MRTTVDLDDAVLELAKHLAQERQQTLGRVLSDLVVRALTPAIERKPGGKRSGANTIPTLPRKPNAHPVTSQMVKDLLESEE